MPKAANTSAEIARLIAKREMYFSIIQKTYDLSKTIEDALCLKEFRKHLYLVENSRDQFIKLTDEINRLSIQDTADFIPDYGAVVSLEQLYAEIKYIESTIVDEKKIRSVDKCENSIPNPKSHLPAIAIPKFSGDIQKWPLFYETFKTLIHENPEIDQTSKYHYLVGALDGPVLNIFNTILPTTQNYFVLWDALITKYQNNRYLAVKYFKQLISFKTINSSQLHVLLERFDTAVKALNQLNIPNMYDFLITSLALSKLESNLQEKFETYFKGEYPTYQELIDFLHKSQKIHDHVYDTRDKTSSRTRDTTHSFLTNNISFRSCFLCKEKHNFFNCSKFIKMNVDEKWSTVKRLNLCSNCLGHKKNISCKSKKTCYFCQKRHHTLLHSQTKVNDSSNQNNVKEVKDSSNNLCVINQTRLSHSINLMPTANVYVNSKDNKINPLRVIIDTASDRNFVTESFCRSAFIEIIPVNAQVMSIGNATQKITGIVNFNITSNDGSFQMAICAYVVREIVKPQPSVKIPFHSIHQFLTLHLADNKFFVSQKVDGIFGSDVFNAIILSNHIKNPDSPIALDTKLGYVIMGSIPNISSQNSEITNLCTMTDDSLSRQMAKFLELEDIPEMNSLQNDYCEQFYTSTTMRDSDGRYIVALPFNSNANLNSRKSFEQAYKRLCLLERKFNKQPDFHKQYSDVVQDYLRQNHMSFRNYVNNHNIEDGYYIPHFAVFKESSSTPLRIVFDASAKNTEFSSLNDQLYSGPKLQLDISTILLNFRYGKIALIGDIKQMYRNIWIRDQDKRFQKILWRFSQKDPIGIYELNTVTFGITSSPFHALRTVKQLAQDECSRYPLITKTIYNDIYIDDIVTSTDSLKSAKELYSQLSSLFRSGGFELCKWTSNDSALCEHFESTRNTQINFSQTNHELTASVKVLGLRWDPAQDCFQFNINLSHQTWTKRKILSVIARIWDPLGFISPIIIKIKMIMKEIWLLKINWDDSLPPTIISAWLAVYDQLSELSNLTIPRFVGTQERVHCSLLGFADSSEKAYGAVVYIKPVNDDRYYLLMSKSKITPIKIQTLARLELCAAHLLAKLLAFIINSNNHSLNINHIYNFSDSMIVLHWLSGPIQRWKSFVANKVTKIHELIPSAQWFHISSESNIADCVSRGLLPKAFLKNNNWFHGPSWLNFPMNHWPISSALDPLPNLPEEKVNTLIVKSAIQQINPLYDVTQKFSGWNKLVKTFAYILKFCKIITKQKQFSTSDLRQAEITIIRLVQEHHFSNELKLLKTGSSCSKPFRRLNLVLDSNYCLRVQGRLGLEIKENPLLLPKKDQVVNCLIDYYHIKNLHTGSNIVLSLLRQKYWILAARSLIRNRLHKCITCFRNNPKPSFPFMGNLPAPRIKASRAFLNVGVDYAGPFHISMSHHRGARTYKAYICLFICLATKAVHLELASDLTSDTFLDCLKRFLARRGPIECIYSDCGTNFVGARNTLNSLFHLLNSEEYKRALQ
uniref:Putative bel12 ag transposon polyprotein n=1 Tax=Xenopsylla cheopis TaxID=163159 RepID=A0A6M2DPC6_XENCH